MSNIVFLLHAANLQVPNKVREMMRKQIIDMVLATDMKQHFAIHSMFQAKMQLNGTRPGGGSGGKSMRGSPHSTADSNAVHHKPVDDDLKSLVLQVRSHTVWVKGSNGWWGLSAETLQPRCRPAMGQPPHLFLTASNCRQPW